MNKKFFEFCFEIHKKIKKNMEVSGLISFEYISFRKLLSELYKACEDTDYIFYQNTNIKDGLEILTTKVYENENVIATSEYIVPQHEIKGKISIVYNGIGARNTYLRKYALMEIFGFHPADSDEIEEQTNKEEPVEKQEVKIDDSVKELIDFAVDTAKLERNMILTSLEAQYEQTVKRLKEIKKQHTKQEI